MLIKLKAPRHTWTEDNREHLIPVGSVIEVDGAEAKRLIAAGVAVPASDGARRTHSYRPTRLGGLETTSNPRQPETRS